MLTENTHPLFIRLCVLPLLFAAASACSTSDLPFQAVTSPAVASQHVSTDGPANGNEESTESTHAVPESEAHSETQTTAPAATLPAIALGQSNTESVSTDNTTGPVNSEASCTTELSAMRQRSLQLINQARTIARSCGTEYFAAAQALSWNVALETAASQHSRDMATHNFFDHTGSDSSSVTMRVTNAGYIWRTVGENIAAGRRTAAATIEDWLESPGHCANIMSPNFTEVAVSCIEDNNTDYGRYWTSVLAAPR